MCNCIKTEEIKEKYYRLIDSIVELQDAGLGDSLLSKTQDYANSKIIEIELNTISELEKNKEEK